MCIVILGTHHCHSNVRLVRICEHQFGRPHSGRSRLDGAGPEVGCRGPGSAGHANRKCRLLHERMYSGCVFEQCFSLCITLCIKCVSRMDAILTRGDFKQNITFFIRIYYI